MRFGSPEFFKWLLLLLPLIALFVFMHRQRAARLSKLIAASIWKTVIPGHREQRSRIRTGLRLLALLCIGLALTRPQWGSHWEEVKQRGLDLIVVLDTSKSMLAEDLKPNRLKQAQWAVRDFVKQLKGDRIGLVAFAGSSFLQCPATVDYAAFTMTLDDLYAGIIPRGGTAIEQALKTAAESFDTKSESDRVILLITDGEDHEGDPLRMAEQLRKEGIKLFAIGVGTLDGELIPAQAGYVKNPQGQVVKSALNEPLLEKLARETGGFYVRAAPGDFGLDRIYKQGLSGLQRKEQETRLARVYEERFGWFAGAALLLLLAEGLFRPAALVVLLLLWSTPPAEAADWVKAYRQGDYTNALPALEKMSETFPDIASYNRGNVLYREKDYAAAEKAYGSAAAQTASPEVRQQALFNRGNALLAGAVKQNGPDRTDAALSAATQAAGLFEQALALKPSDLDAKQNLERALILKEKLEQQKKEQERQKQDQQKQKQEDDQKNPQQQDPQQKQDQPKQPDEQNKPTDRPQEQQKPSDQANQNNQKQQQDRQQPDQPRRAGEMSEEEARQLLDAMKQNEQDQRANLTPFLGGPIRVEKDW
ncbi:MAG TPA: VWA domain-containing protein [Pontiellaceae bacterium]|nr:VWA domain-containing protein [Pontiellaceae bacterium]